MEILLPKTCAIAVLAGHWSAMTEDGEFLDGPLKDTSTLPKNTPYLVCHAPYAASLLSLGTRPSFDVLELFAFVCAGQFCVPTIGGLCRVLGLEVPKTTEDSATALLTITNELLITLADTPDDKKPKLCALAQAMGAQGHGWAWTPFVMSALGEQYDPRFPLKTKDILAVWDNLNEWADEAPPTPPGSQIISGDAARAHLGDLLTRRRGAGGTGDLRADQENYTTRIVPAFTPRDVESQPQVVTAEAGTGVGKTLGYLAPAQLWAETNEGAVWVSTYTRNLQSQIDIELGTLYPDKTERDRKAVIRKGRENYLCLLNYQELANAAQFAKAPHTVIAAALMARWIMETRDGDLTGNDFPGWMPGLMGIQNTTMLADRRGECIYAACDHYHKCFIEKATRKASRARIIIGNHALAMTQLVMNDPSTLPTRYIFDEGHHIFDAADSTFSAHLSATETHDLRRWIMGPDDDGPTRRSRRAKGLKKRLDGLVPEDDPAHQFLEDALHAARDLPNADWRKHMGDNAPKGGIETFLHQVSNQVLARAGQPDSFYSIECDVNPLGENILATIPKAIASLHAIHKPLLALSKFLRERREKEFDDLSPDYRARLESSAATLERRAQSIVGAWIEMLDQLNKPKNETYVDWFEITRVDGRNYDVGFFRHHLEPTRAFSDELKHHAHGVLFTSATLKDSPNNDETDWIAADKRSGAGFLSPLTPERVSVPSPFNYQEQTRIIIIRDIPKNDLTALAHAYGALFKASKGGALGLFTSIHRLKNVYKTIAPALNETTLPLYAQHVDDIDIGTLVDMFREEEDACLLGTDAVRDGVDVPGRSLRLIAFDRVPWPRPTILHRERRKAFGGKEYDEMLTRMKLRQAYGRLIRSNQDRGVFVMCDPGFPTRLENSFPGNAEVIRTDLNQAIEIIENFI